MLYVDSCIPMYLVGSAHPLKNRIIEILPELVESGQQLITSAETFQEIIHRFKAIKSVKDLSLGYEALEEIATEVVDVKKADTDQGRSLIAQFPKLSSRDCLHVAIMKRVGSKKIWTYDEGFDLVPFIERIR